MLDDDALNLVGDVIKAVHSILQMLVDLAAADELERIPAFDLLVEQLQPTVVGVVGVPFDARDLQADFVKLSGVACNVGQLLRRRVARVRNIRRLRPPFSRMSGSKFVISNSMMAFAVALH